MAAHIKFRKDRNSFYLVDGALISSLKTDKKTIARYLLEEHIRGKYGLRPTPTVGDFYAKWIERKVEPLVRRAQARDYRQHFATYILPAFKDAHLLAIGAGDLTDFQVKLVRRGLSVKTARNIVDGSFRALYRDARAEIRDLEGRDPFIDVKWPKNERELPDPFTAEERNRLLEYARENRLFYYPWLFTQFHTGMRPSESTALRQRDIDYAARTISINKSRYLGAQDKTKTTGSKRIITVSPEIIELIKAICLPWVTPESSVFYNKMGGAITASEWVKSYWREICEGAKVRYRKFYSTRHTFITESIKSGENIKAVADYCGTSLDMIQKDYCARLELNQNQTKIEPQSRNSVAYLASPTGFEPVLSA